MNFAKKIVATLMLGAALPALAASKTVTLSIANMTCAVCPITVKKALNAVPGVSKTEVIFAKKEAVVTYDDAKTNVAALAKATLDAGYPAIVQGPTASGTVKK